jgi:hypothetical protein
MPFLFNQTLRTRTKQFISILIQNSLKYHTKYYVLWVKYKSVRFFLFEEQLN